MASKWIALQALQFVVFAVCLELSECQGIDAEVTPLRNFTLPVTFNGNITYECAVTPGFQPEWNVNNFQLVNPSDRIPMAFAARGIILERVQSNITRLVITPEGREQQLMGGALNTITCKCTGILRGIRRGDTTLTVTVTTYNRPEAPVGLTLDSTVDGLSLVWMRPGNAVAQSNTTYNVSIFNVTESGHLLYQEVTGQSATSFSIHPLEESLLGMPCQRFQFVVTAENDAGVGVPSVYNETVPLSANTSDVDATLSLVSLELGFGDNVTLVIEFRTVNSCSTNFPVLSYTINLNNRVALVVPASSVEPLTITRFVLDSRNMSLPVAHNTPYELDVTVRSEVSERTSRGILFRTTDVQSAEVVFFQNNVLLRCVFANRTLSRGCVFTFTPDSNGTGKLEFFIERDAEQLVLSQCNQTESRLSAYTGRIELRDVESDGSQGDFVIFPLEREVGDPGNFTLLTGCELDSDEFPTPSVIDVVPIVVPIVVPVVVVVVVAATMIALAVIIVIYLRWRRKKNSLNEALITTKADLSNATEELKQEKQKKARKPSLTKDTDGSFKAKLDPGKLWDLKKMTPSASSQSDLSVAHTPTTPPPDAMGGPPSYLPLPEPTGSTSSCSPPRPRKPHNVKRSQSEPGTTPLLSEEEAEAIGSKGMLKLLLSKDSIEIKVKGEQLIEYVRKNRRERSQRFKSRSKSVSNELSTQFDEESAPLLMTLSEIHIHSDVLEAISEEHLETLEESTGPTSPTSFLIGSSPPHTPSSPSSPADETGTNGEIQLRETGPGVTEEEPGHEESAC